jgi:capsular exopolysaccharide synthesis family protein
MTRGFTLLPQSRVQTTGGLETSGLIGGPSETSLHACFEPDEPGCAGHFSIPTDPTRRLVAFTNPLTPAAEKFRGLSSRLKHIQKRSSLKRLLVTSAVPGEGKSLIAANLAITIASHKQRTLLIDGDLRRASVTKMVDLSGRTGLRHWWKAKLPVESILYRNDQLPLWLLPSDMQTDSPVNILQSPELQQLIAAMSALFEWVIIDSPPITVFADAASWSVTADGIILVARYGVTPASCLGRALKEIDTAKIAAIVLNGADVREEHNYYAHYYGHQIAP